MAITLSACRARVYPRPRGGAAAGGAPAHRRRGLSPPTRGSLRGQRDLILESGSIPAHAGEPSQMISRPAAPAVYPRPRGGASDVRRLLISVSGLSPPTRGSPLRCRDGGVVHGSIPAHAGEPARTSSRPATSDCGLSPPTRGSHLGHPRPRGGAFDHRIAHAGEPEGRAWVGLSPPTRGSPIRAQGGKHRRRAGSIPAHAGEPVTSCSASAMPIRGLSPPTRGSHREPRWPERRSIPPTRSSAIGVYPRPRGGARARDHVTRAVHQRVYRPRGGAFDGSIPAHAGEPRCQSGGSRGRAIRPGRPTRGSLSPPTRGSRVRRPRSVRGVQGSIPASPVEVYPRPRGGAVVAAGSITTLARMAVYPRPRGGAFSAMQRVYPRPRGGASRAANWGLSPPTRGSLL